MQRLDRILSEAGVASRKELRAIIRAGRVTADGAVVTDESRKFDEAAVHIAVDSQPVRLRGPVLIMLHKPAGYLTAADDPKAKTVMELVPDEYRRLGVMPVGRLDKDTEGLLLLTNDGEWMHHLLHPRYEMNKTYEVSVAGAVRGAQEALSSMTQLDGEPVRPAQVRVLRQGRDTALLSITIHEGKNRQIRRMCAAAGLHVKRLKRVQEHTLKLGDLPEGAWRNLTEQELLATKSK